MTEKYRFTSVYNRSKKALMCTSPQSTCCLPLAAFINRRIHAQSYSQSINTLLHVTRLWCSARASTHDEIQFLMLLLSLNLPWWVLFKVMAPCLVSLYVIKFLHLRQDKHAASSKAQDVLLQNCMLVYWKICLTLMFKIVSTFMLFNFLISIVYQ